MKPFNKPLLLSLTILLAGLSLPALAQNNALVGAGSTLAYPLLSKVFDGYSRVAKQSINYQANGSGAGMALLSQKTIDFVATDAPLTDERAKKLGAPVVYIPIAISTVAIAYNVPGIKAALKLNADILTGIYSGKITKWNDARIAKLNAGIKLPSLRILAAHRSDDSGSTYIFTQYFKDDTNWHKIMGGTIPVKWPVGTGIKSNQGIAGLIKLTPGAMGYVALPYAIQYKIPLAGLQVKTGGFAAAHKVNYPLKGNTGIIVYKQQDYSGRSLDKTKQLIKLLRYTISEAQKEARALNYQPLSAHDINTANKAIRTITYNGKNL